MISSALLGTAQCDPIPQIPVTTGANHVTGEYAGCSAAFSASTIAARTSPISPAGVEGGAGRDGVVAAKTGNFTTTLSSVVASMQKERGWCEVVVLDPYLE